MSPIKRRRALYSKEDLMKAVHEVKEGKMNSFEAANHYKVPSSTIRCHVNEYSSRIGAGPPFYLNEQQETYLIETIKSLEAIGIRLIKPVLKKVCSEYMQMVSTNSRYSSKSQLLIFQFCCIWIS